MHRAMERLAALLLLAPPAVAQVTAIGPFNGAFHEGFESQSTHQTGACVAERIFSDRADLCASFGSAIAISTGLPGGPQPHAGLQMFHADVVSELRFDQPARRFGGWFATTWVSGPGMAWLYDASGALIDSVPFQLVPCAPACTWVWNGWEVTGAGIARIVFDTPTGTGGHFELDDLEVTFECDGAVELYCTAKSNSLGCVPAIAASGQPSASATAGFVVAATQVLNQHVGLMIYSLTGRAAVPFQGGWRCVAIPVYRTVPVLSGGSAPPSQDCSGVYSLDVNAFAHGLLGGAPRPGLLQPGTQVRCQWWGRDTGLAPPWNTSLSDALEYSVCP